MSTKYEYTKFVTVYTIEFKKIDLNQAYLLITLHLNNKIIILKQVDSLIFAEIPNDCSKLKNFVIEHMLHRLHDKLKRCFDPE